MRVLRINIEKKHYLIRNMENPIKDNRIVNDKTFAIRFKSFIEEVKVCDMPSEEEKEYLLMVADKLLKYQFETATEENEKKYLKKIS